MNVWNNHKVVECNVEYIYNLNICNETVSVEIAMIRKKTKGFHSFQIKMQTSCKDLAFLFSERNKPGYKLVL